MVKLAIACHDRSSLLMRSMFASLAKDEEGAALVEYGLLVGLIAVVCIGAVTTLGLTISGVFGAINAQLTPIAGG
jgi:pilus assembly protein Flp/PilA